MRWQGKEGREEGRGHKGTRNDRDRGGEIYLARSRAVAILGGGGGGGGGGGAGPPCSNPRRKFKSTRAGLYAHAQKRFRFYTWQAGSPGRHK